MTEPADAISDQQAQDHGDSDLLLLPSEGGAVPRMVYVKLLSSDPTSTVGFALDPGATADWKPGGVKWEFGSDAVKYGLFINFILMSGIKELVVKEPITHPHPTFWFSKARSPADGQPQSQWSCTPIVPRKRTTYRFIAKLTGGGMIDPKIVVTPFPGNDEPPVQP